MKAARTTALIGMVALTTMLAACSSHRDISFDGRSVTLHVASTPAATITANGGFSIGAKAINITPAQRQLLQNYYTQVTALHAHAITFKQRMKKTGLHMAGQALHMVGQSVEHAAGMGHASSASNKAAAKVMQGEGNQIQDQVQRMCQEIKQTKTLQVTLGNKIPAFGPYAGINPVPGVSCGHDQTITII
ncbi:MAG TPA: hypothetical protein VF269_08460 [Rhodanobacteraceae bacterium]